MIRPDLIHDLLTVDSEELEAAEEMYDKLTGASIISIGFPPRTRVYHLERDVDDPAWNIWIAMPHGAVNVPSLQRFGTFLRLWDGGAMERVTRDESGVRVMQIKEKD